jgi:hypothetical protein
MSQYNPLHRAADFGAIARTITASEYDEAVEMALSLGFENLLTQDLEGAAQNAVPDFTDSLTPFKEF